MNPKIKKFIEYGNTFWTYPSYYVTLFCWIMMTITHHFFPENKSQKWDYIMEGAFFCFTLDLYINYTTKQKLEKKQELEFTKDNPWGEKPE